mgnify:CR=1 FL=1
MVEPGAADWGFVETVCRPEAEIDLAEAALWIAAGEYPDLLVPDYLARLDDLARAAPPSISRGLPPADALEALSEYLFEIVGFRGNVDDYYDPRNSYLNEVLDRRLGIPITLSVLYIEVARRLGIPVVGVGMPGHFIVRHRDEPDLFVDPFSGGTLLDAQGCVARLSVLAGRPVTLAPEHLAPVGARAIIIRMLTNLKAIYVRQNDWDRALAAIDRLLILAPTRHSELVDRAAILFQLGRFWETAHAIETARRLAPDVDPEGTERLWRTAWRRLARRN